MVDEDVECAVRAHALLRQQQTRIEGLVAEVAALREKHDDSDDDSEGGGYDETPAAGCKRGRTAQMSRVADERAGSAGGPTTHASLAAGECAGSAAGSVSGPSGAASGGGTARDAVVAAMSAQLEEVMKELEKVKRGAVPSLGVPARKEVAHESVLDLVFRPSHWIGGVIDNAGSQAEAQARADALLMAIDRQYRIAELRPGGVAAQASARALEAVRIILTMAARNPEDAEQLSEVIRPVATTLYSNYLLLTHGAETAGRWQTAVAAHVQVDEDYAAALQSLPPVLRRPRDQEGRGRGSWGARGRQGMRGRGWNNASRRGWTSERRGDAGRGPSDASGGRAGEAGGSRRGPAAAGKDDGGKEPMQRRG